MPSGRTPQPSRRRRAPYAVITRRAAVRSFALVALAIDSHAEAQRPDAAAPEPRRLLIHDVILIDGTGSAPRPGMSVLIRGDRIERMAPAREAMPANDTIAGRGLFLIPGLFDGHVHLGTRSRDDEASQLQRALAGGVTAVIDMASDTRVTGALATAVRDGQLEGPAIYYAAVMAGPAFFTDPRAAAASRGYQPGTAPWLRAITDTTDVPRAIAEARRTGASVIKIYAALPPSLVERVTAEAHRQQLPVLAHAAVFPARPGDLVRAGVDLLVHTPYLVWEGSPPSPDFARRARGDYAGISANDPRIEQLLATMRDRGTALNPTLLVFADAPDASSTPNRTDWMYTVTRRAFALGIPIVAGTDGLFGRGGSDRDGLPQIHRELEMLVTHGGLTPLAAITAATANAARAVRADSVRGTIRPGLVADLVLLSADPAADIRNTQRIRYVIRQGRIVRREP